MIFARMQVMLFTIVNRQVQIDVPCFKHDRSAKVHQVHAGGTVILLEGHRVPGSAYSG